VRRDAVFGIPVDDDAGERSLEDIVDEWRDDTNEA
jgi:hypothetical protein